MNSKTISQSGVKRFTNFQGIEQVKLLNCLGYDTSYEEEEMFIIKITDIKYMLQYKKS
jgi:hypothetical protein